MDQRCAQVPGGPVMVGRCYDLILTSMTVALIFAAPLGALAQVPNKPAASFNERFPVDQTAAEQAPASPEAKKEQNGATSRHIASMKRTRTRVVVAPRSFLNAGTEVRPGERKFLDYAFPPTHVALGVVTNTGGRVGWHN